MSFPLDPAPQDMQAMGEAAVSYLIGFIQGLDDAPAEATEGALDLANRLRAVPPEHGGEFAAVFAEAQEAISRTFEYAGPGYLAYIPGGGLYTAALAEFIAQGVNRYVGLWQPSPAVVQIEENVTRWLCDLFDYPEGSQGLLLSGGSMANLSAMVTARHAKLGEDFTDGVYYVSEQAHASVPKAATIAGFSKRNVRIVATDDELRMDPQALRTQIARDRADGLRPFLVAPSVGTTNTGAIDPIADIADIAEAEKL
ncbi:MAG: pyridoxal-dependent decarboxylase, partial [Actinomycetota bacterium]